MIYCDPLPPRGVHVVYMLTHATTRKSYVGSTCDLARRLRQHCSKSSNPTASISVAINELGHEKIEVRVLAECVSKEAAELVERHHTLSLRTQVPEGWNVNAGKHPSAATRAKMSATQKGVPKSAAHRAALSGVPVSAETRAKISASKKGVPMTAEARVVMAAAQKERQANVRMARWLQDLSLP